MRHTPPHKYIDLQSIGLKYSSRKLIKSDVRRQGEVPLFQRWLRRRQTAKNCIWLLICRIMYRLTSYIYCNDIQALEIGEGLYIGHPFSITINYRVKIGKNVNIHKGCTIGQENRGKRKGVPIIGDCVYIGINSTVVGKINIGNDVMIAPNSFVNCDVPSHSIVFGNPCIIKHRENATEGYINNKV